MKKKITSLIITFFVLVSSVAASVGSSASVDMDDSDQVRAELNLEKGTVREVDGKFIFTGKVQVSFFDPTGFEIQDVKAAILDCRGSNSESGQVVPLLRAGKGRYAAEVLLTKKSDLHLKVSMILESGEMKEFDFLYTI